MLQFTVLIIEEGWREKQRSSCLFGGQNLFNSLPLPRLLFCLGRFGSIGWFPPFSQIDRGKTGCAARQWINSAAQTDATTFAFASLSILILWFWLLGSCCSRASSFYASAHCAEYWGAAVSVQGAGCCGAAVKGATYCDVGVQGAYSRGNAVQFGFADCFFRFNVLLFKVLTPLMVFKMSTLMILLFSRVERCSTFFLF